MANGKHPLAAAPDLDVDAEHLSLTALEQFHLLEDEFLSLQGDDSEGAATRRWQLRQAMKAFGPHAHCGDEPIVTMEVPVTVTKDPFTINGKAYFGTVQVAACIARELAWRISRNRQVDRDRLRGQSFLLPETELPKLPG